MKVLASEYFSLFDQVPQMPLPITVLIAVLVGLRPMFLSVSRRSVSIENLPNPYILTDCGDSRHTRGALRRIA